MNDWDVNDWQGRTKEQVESSYKGCGWIALIAILTATVINGLVLCL